MNDEVNEEKLFKDMESYVNHLDKFVETLMEFYNLHELETFYRA